jgi:superfamily II DNA or RNA helicase
MTKKVPTLVLVNTIELANQTKAAFLKFTNAVEDDIGFVGSGKFILSPITICLHQTMAHLSDTQFELLNDYFGMVIADEVHIIAASTYYQTMSKLTAKYKFGFSATPKRDDGLTPVIHYATGPKIHTVPKESLSEHLIKPSIKYVDTEYYFPLLSTQEYQEMISDLSFNPERNAFIANILATEYADNYCILLCNRVEQVTTLVKLIGDTAVGLTSKMKKKDRLQAIKDLNSKAKRHVVSTYGLFSTGIDIPHLDTLLLCAPIKSEIKVRQSAGRLMRKSPGKDSATIVDFVDKKIELLKYQAAKRRRILNNL